MKPLYKRISLPQPTIVLHGSGVALACGYGAEIESDHLHGLFAGDTRVLSSFRILVSGQSWTLLGWEREGSATATFSFQNPKLVDLKGEIPEGTLLFRLRRRIDGAMHDHCTVTNFGRDIRFLRLTFLIDADFSDIFNVHDQTPIPHLEIERIPHEHGVHFLYVRKTFRRGLFLNVHSLTTEPQYVGSSIVFDVELASESAWDCCFDAVPEIGRSRLFFIGDPHGPERDVVPSHEGILLKSDPILKGPFERGRLDLHSLAIPQKNAPPFLAAGAPWFLTLFARDTLMTSLMMGVDGTWAAEGALSALAERQAASRDDWRDAEPGKFPHEIRVGELASFGVVPHSSYYAAHDAQALYCLALWNAWRWTGRRDLLDSYFEVATRALRWCDELGDRDGDGLLEYQTRSRKGYYNQSWKDAGDAILDDQGKIASLPLATIELQGYLYAARLAMAELNAALGNEEEAMRLVHQARQLRELVEEKYWMESEGFYAVALDGEKRMAKSISSNPGHLLWCGLAQPERAARVASRLLEQDMFTGWGLRTLSSQNPAYNPLSYQRGSVWPHDTALASSGLWRYGLYEQADRLLEAVLEAATVFDQHRLPELFAGMQKSETGPTPYVSANIPQAWAAAVPLLSVQLFLGLVPDAPQRRCFLSPRLPFFLKKLEVRNLPIGEDRIRVKLIRKGDRTVIEALQSGETELIQGAPAAPLWGAPM